MFSGERIPTPWREKWRRFRYGAMPVVCFVLCGAASLWLWQRQGQLPNAVGEIEAVRVDVAAAIDGRLAALSSDDAAPADKQSASLPGHYWKLFDTVSAGDVIAKLDERPVRARLEACRAELDKVRKEVDAETANVMAEDSMRRMQHLRDILQLRWDAVKQSLEVLDRRVVLETQRVELKRRNERLRFLNPLHEKQIVAEMDFTEEQLLRDKLAVGVDESEKALKAAEAAQVSIRQELAKTPSWQTVDLPKILAPLKADIDVQEAAIKEVLVEAEQLVIHAPISGTICAVYYYPGQTIKAGDPIVTIAAQKGRYVVSFVRQEQRLHLVEGMSVDLRVRAAASRQIASKVERVGPQVEPVPSHLLRDPRLLEWGLPVRIALPDEISLRPGELIDVRFHAAQVKKEG